MLAESLSSTPSIWAFIGSWLTPTVFFVVLNLMIGTILITSSFSAQKQQHQLSHGIPLPQQLPTSPSVFQRLKSLNFNHSTSPQPTHHSPQFHNHDIFGQPRHPQMARSPSIFERLKSMNVYNHSPIEPVPAKLLTSADSNGLHTTSTVPSEMGFHFQNTHELEKHHLRASMVESEEERDDENDVVVQIPHASELPRPERSLDGIYRHSQGTHVTRTKFNTTPASGEMPVKLPGKMKKSAFAHFKEDDIVENYWSETMKETKHTAAELVDDEVDAKADDFINKFKEQLKLQRLDSMMS